MVKNIMNTIVAVIVIFAVFCGIMFCGAVANTVATLAGADLTVAIMCVAGFFIGVAVQWYKTWMETE